MSATHVGNGYATNDDCRSVMANAHKVQKIDTSLHFTRNCAVQQLQGLLRWPFLLFICKIVSYRYVDTFSISHVVAAQEVV